MPPRMSMAAAAASRSGNRGSPQGATNRSPQFAQAHVSPDPSPLDPHAPKDSLEVDKGQLLHLFFYFAFLIVMYYMILATIPVHSLASSNQGIMALTSNVAFTRLNKERATIADVSTLDDAVMWTEAMISAALTEESYRGLDIHAHKSTRLPDEHLMVLRVHRLINTILISQRRVAPSDCSYEGMKPIYEDCYEHLEDHEITKGHLLLNDGVTEISYRPGDNGATGGFAVDLPLDKQVAIQEFQDLRREGFWDRATWEFTMAFAFHNSPGHYTGYCQVVFSMSPYGLVNHDVKVQFLRLRPYSEETDGMWLLGLQITVITGMLVLMVVTIRDLVRQPHIRWCVAHCLRAWFVMDLIMYVFVGMSIYYWISYLNDPMKKKFSFAATKYQDLNSMAAQFETVMLLQSLALMVAVIRLIEFFGKFKRLQFIVTVLERSSESVAWFCVIFITLFIGFALVGHVLFGVQETNFATVESGVQTLGLWFVALGGGQENLFNYTGGDIFLILFILMMMVLLLNFIVTIVMGAYDEVMNEDEDQRAVAKKPLNHAVADMICDKLGIAPYANDPYNIKPIAKEEDQPLMQDHDDKMSEP